MPDGLDGMRLDQAVSRLFGLSRTAAAALVEAGDALVDGVARAKSEKVAAGAWLEVTLPAPADGAGRRPGAGARPARGLQRRRHRGGGQAGRRGRPPEPRLDRPDRASAGWPRWASTIATSGAAERQGVVHRLDVGTTGLMVVAKSEHAYSVLKRAFKEREVDKRYHAVVQGHLDPLRGTVDAPIDRHPTHDYKWAVVTGGQAERHPLRHAGGVPGGEPASTSSWRPAAPTRSGCTSRRCGTRASAT